MPALTDPLTLRGVTLPNRVAISPMCQYSSEDGFATDWHLVHLGARAVGGAGLVMTEATAVEARGRISPEDLGLWKDAHVEPLSRIARFVAAQGAVPGIQLAHAGRKGSTPRPWDKRGLQVLTPDDGGWQPVAPSALPFYPDAPPPHALSETEIADVVAAFAAAARRAVAAGFRLVELHAAHGYLAHEFLSPLSNHRTDRYGGPFDNRVRFALEAARAIRAALPDDVPLVTRVSATDWVDGGWDLEQTVELARSLRAEGVDAIDCSSGGTVPHARVPVGPGYQVPFAAAVRRRAEIATAAVGMLTEPAQADGIIARGEADFVMLARASLRDADWPLHAFTALGHPEARRVPEQYTRAW